MVIARGYYLIYPDRHLWPGVEGRIHFGRTFLFRHLVCATHVLRRRDVDQSQSMIYVIYLNDVELKKAGIIDQLDRLYSAH